MKKQIVKKIISTTIVFIFAIFFLQILSPNIISAANELNWENPNKNGQNPYKFKPKDALNSQLIMQVVGCTGVVDKVSAAITGLVQRKSREFLKQKLEDKLAEKIIKYCDALKESAVAGSSMAINLQLTTAEIEMIDCGTSTLTTDKKLLRQLMDDATKKATSDRVEQCFNGIAITLARNQLTAMTRYTVNWVNSGFKGDPMYVRNITSLTNSMERNVLETGIDILNNEAQKAFPYGRDFSRSLVTSYKTGGVKYGATNFLDSLTSDLGAFVTDPRSYYPEELLDETPLERSRRVNYAFSNDFATGGWNGWLGLTQREQNNPLGFTMLASQYLSDQKQQKIEETKQDLLVNDGILSQKRCTKWKLYGDDGKPLISEDIDIWSDDYLSKDIFVYSTNKKNAKDQCVQEETVTPGSLIKDKVSTYLNSPERQLELADTINESLNALFTALIARFQNQGLSSLSSEDYAFSNPNMGVGYGSNSFDDIDMFGETTSSGYTNGSFDLTRDLGNKYVHNYVREDLGNWDAKTNKVWDNNLKLNIGIGPRDTRTGDPLTNVYYTVTVPGETKLFENGYNGWNTGDRAFWDGNEWQNWKKGVANPTKERGVIQIQKDYIVAANELLKKLPSIMPKIGELDYCIPGPNPSWETITSESQERLQDYLGSLKSSYDPGSLWKLERNGMIFSKANPGDPEYDNYQNIFNGTSRSWWQSVSESHPMARIYELGTRGRANNNNDMEAQNERTERGIDEINYSLENFNKIFKENMSYLYGDRMLKPFKEKENTAILEPNPNYLPMAEEGLGITKNILSYDEDIKSAIESYNDSVVEANSNIYKLDQIRSKVSEIIIAAQARRDARLLEILEEETTEKCRQEREICLARTDLPPDDIDEICGGLFGQCNQNTMTEAEYKTKYASCFEEEDILYMEDLEITNYESEEGRCNDGLDNDRDRLIDFKDDDCSGSTTPPDGKHCIIKEEYVNSSNSQNNLACKSRMTETQCVANDYFNNNLAYVCDWNTGTGLTPPTESTYGCTIDRREFQPPSSGPTKHCLQRTQTECTANKYIDENAEYSYICKWVTPTPPPGVNHCVTRAEFANSSNSPNNSSCSSRTSAALCVAEHYYNNDLEYICAWGTE